MRLDPHLSFNGNCEAAFRFYERCLGGKITFIMTYGETPEASSVSPEWQKKIIHATLIVGDYLLQGADAPETHYERPQGFSLSLDVDDPTKADRIFAALSESGSVTFPIQETFWARRFGMLLDQFGIPWMINCGKPST